MKVFNILTNIGVALISILLTLAFFYYTLEYIVIIVQIFAVAILVGYLLFKLNDIGKYIISKIKGG